MEKVHICTYIVTWTWMTGCVGRRKKVLDLSVQFGVESYPEVDVVLVLPLSLGNFFLSQSYYIIFDEEVPISQ